MLDGCRSRKGEQSLEAVLTVAILQLQQIPHGRSARRPSKLEGREETDCREKRPN